MEGEQEKAPALLLRRCGHNHPQCGRFRKRELTLFGEASFLIDADIQKNAEKHRCYTAFDNAITK